MRHASSLTIEPHLGDFEGLEDTYLNNNNLVIPVSFYNWPLRAAVQVFTGIEPKPDNLGVLNGLQVDFASRGYSKRPWWKLWGSKDQYIEVPGSDQTDMSTLVYSTLSN